ncbi:hypothetical protein CNEO3_100062 [Clostridium neonatale]|nr:hypothetical protein CNEO_250004 [Clostridium neonatale]CAG9715207.1 hypothetical protein CNEO_300058 [Clostridium neonatale]CAI3538945.1 hypothetical protein CNEO3_180004 [Clostridium neonatale]CAI3551751.1 hypothetical protein CNEO3_100062 [Clostridium neonatale]CAI3573628.1 hypothetical protein CNEO4_180052 [Clostridium neonatale]
MNFVILLILIILINNFRLNKEIELSCSSQSIQFKPNARSGFSAYAK